MFKRIGIPLALFTVLVLAVTAMASANGGNGNKNDKQRICHATGSSSNPFVSIEPNKNGDVSGHAGQSHQDGRDIIPPFTYNDHGTDKAFPGQNWDATGQAIWANDCNKSSSPPPPPTSNNCPAGYSEDSGSTPARLLCTRTVTVTNTVNVPVPGPVQIVVNTIYGSPQCATGKEIARGQGTVTCEVAGPERIQIVYGEKIVYGKPVCPKTYKKVKGGPGLVVCTKTVVKNKVKTIFKVRVVQAPKPAYTK